MSSNDDLEIPDDGMATLKAAIVSKIMELLKMEDRISSQVGGIVSDIRWSALDGFIRSAVCIQAKCLATLTSDLVAAQIKDLKAAAQMQGIMVDDGDLLLTMKPESESDDILPPQGWIAAPELPPLVEAEVKVKPKRKRHSKKAVAKKSKSKRKTAS